MPLNNKTKTLLAALLLCSLPGFSQLKGKVSTSTPVAFGCISCGTKISPNACRGRGICTNSLTSATALISWNEEEDTMTLICNTQDADQAGFSAIDAQDTAKGPDRGDSTYTMGDEVILDPNKWGRRNQAKICAGTVASFARIKDDKTPSDFIMLVIPVKEMQDDCGSMRRKAIKRKKR